MPIHFLQYCLSITFQHFGQKRFKKYHSNNYNFSNIKSGVLSIIKIILLLSVLYNSNLYSNDNTDSYHKYLSSPFSLPLDFFNSNSNHHRQYSNFYYDIHQTYHSLEVIINTCNFNNFLKIKHKTKIKFSCENIAFYGYAKIVQNLCYKYNHILKGNRNTNNKLKITQLNKGNSLFKNKLHSIERMLSQEKLDILCISESNIHRSDTNSLNHFSNYNHELNLESLNIDISRNAILINKKINYKRRDELEDSNICDIVLEINPRGSKPILVLWSYREWQKLNICN